MCVFRIIEPNSTSGIFGQLKAKKSIMFLLQPVNNLNEYNGL